MTSRQSQAFRPCDRRVTQLVEHVAFPLVLDHGRRHQKVWLGIARLRRGSIPLEKLHAQDQGNNLVRFAHAHSFGADAAAIPLDLVESPRPEDQLMGLVLLHLRHPGVVGAWRLLMPLWRIASE